VRYPECEGECEGAVSVLTSDDAPIYLQDELDAQGSDKGRRLPMMTGEIERSILHLRVHSDTGSAELATLPGEISPIPGAEGDYCLIVPIDDRAATPTVLGDLMEMHLDLVSVHLHPA
jgi:hypothetical protein